MNDKKTYVLSEQMINDLHKTIGSIPYNQIAGLMQRFEAELAPQIQQVIPTTATPAPEAPVAE